jgi:hypothetical protein
LIHRSRFRRANVPLGSVHVLVSSLKRSLGGRVRVLVAHLVDTEAELGNLAAVEHLHYG